MDVQHSLDGSASNPFGQNAESVAQKAMLKIDAGLVDCFVQLIRFLKREPNAAARRNSRNQPIFGTEDYIASIAESFAHARRPKAPAKPTTIPDDIVSVVLEDFFGVDKSSLNRIKEEHQLSMGAENLVGDLLERYLASVLEPKGWVWCSGSMVKAADFIKAPVQPNGDWTVLQVKNRDNSENSSSSAIRNGTTIKKWFRTYSRRQGSNWAQFPDEDARPELSEEGFKKYVRNYLRLLPRR
jgi:hypothetical protein